MTTKHTPGPWHVRYAENTTAITTFKGEMRLSCSGDIKPIQVDIQEWEANARLIAAAPELLEALQTLEYLARRSGAFVENAECFTIARAAIAKATP